MRQLLLVMIFCLLATCSGRTPVANFERVPTYAVASAKTRATPIAYAFAAQARSHPKLSGFHLMPNGSEAFLTRIALVEAAKQSVDLQYFSTRDDSTGELLLEALLRAADRGVRVRLLLDGWNLDDFEAGVVALNANPHIEIRVFNPFTTEDKPFFLRPSNTVSRLDPFSRRMHNKALIADNQMAIMGGRNLGDEYFGAGSEFNFRDMDVLAAGPVVSDISTNFDKYWNSKESYPTSALPLPKADPAAVDRINKHLDQYWTQICQSGYGKKFLNHPQLLAQIKTNQIPLVWAPAELVADTPHKIEQPQELSTSKPAIRLDQLVEHAQQEFIIISPYFVPLDQGTQWLTSLSQRGIKVRVLTNSLSSTDMVIAQAGYNHYRESLAAAGVDLYELKAVGGKSPRHMFKGSSSQSSLHAKLYVVDRRDLMIGSFNMDPRSIYFNTEQVLVIHSPELSQQVAEIFERATAPELSFHVMLVPGASQPPLTAPRSGSPAFTETAGHHLVWVTQEHDEQRIYDFDPQASLMRHATSGMFSLLPFDHAL